MAKNQQRKMISLTHTRVDGVKLGILLFIDEIAAIHEEVRSDEPKTPRVEVLIRDSRVGYTVDESLQQIRLMIESA